jgi:outer membrane protein assembly factor BamE
LASASQLFLRFRRALTRGALLAACALAGGCATVETYVPAFRSLGVFRLDINQGNYLTQDMVDKLKEGQTRAQVRSILGTPLVASAFRDSRWDYVYRFERQGRLLENRAFTVFFDGDKLARWEGDEMPQSMAALNRAAVDKSMGHIPSADDPGIFDWLFGIFKRN